MKFDEYLKSLEDKRKSLSVTIAERAQTLADTHEYVKTNLKETDTDYEARMKAFNDALAAQKEIRAEITEVEEVIEQLMIDEYSPMVKSAPGIPKLKSSILGEAPVLAIKPEPRSIDNLGNDIKEYIVRKGYNSLSKMKSLQQMPEALPGGGTFTPALSFHIGFGETDILDDEELSSIPELKTDLEKYRTRKSMFTQHPLAGGQTVLGEGDLYNPEGIFEGNTGGIFEYEVDRTLYNIPYAPMGIMSVLPTQQVVGNQHHFIRQTIRINNATALLDSITTPPVNFIQEKPVNEYGWTLFKTYVMTYASTVILSDEFAEDAQPIADAVKTQLGTDVMRTFANALANAVNTTGHADITGLFNLAGMNTRIHRSTAAYASPLSGTPSVSLAGDDERETLERAVLDLQRFGFSPDYILTSFAVQDKIAFLHDGFGHKLYSEAEQSTIRGAKVVAGSEVTATKAMVGDYQMAVRALLRMGITIEIGFVNDQFVTDQFTIRARVRGGLKAMRPYALERVTFA